MIRLNLAIHDGDIDIIEFKSTVELIDYLKELHSFDCIWLATDNCENDEILITENLQKLINSVIHGHFDLYSEGDKDFHIQEYQTYEDAYAVALDMREGNPRCYN